VWGAAAADEPLTRVSANYVSTDECIRPRVHTYWTSGSLHSFCFTGRLRRPVRCLRSAAQTSSRRERSCATTTTTTTTRMKTATPLAEKIAFASIIARTRHVFSEANRNKLPASRRSRPEMQRRSQRTSRERAASTKLHCGFVALRSTRADGFSYGNRVRLSLSLSLSLSLCNSATEINPDNGRHAPLDSDDSKRGLARIPLCRKTNVFYRFSNRSSRQVTESLRSLDNSACYHLFLSSLYLFRDTLRDLALSKLLFALRALH